MSDQKGIDALKVEHEHIDAQAQLGQMAENNEHGLSAIQTIRKFPWVFAWAFYAVITCLLVSFENQAGGMVLSIPEFRKDFGYYYEGSYVLYTNWQSAFYGAPLAACIIGTFGAGYMADVIGRKPVLAAALVLSFASVTLEYIATTNPVFFGGKFLNGIVIGIIMSVSITYIGEVRSFVHVSRRHRLTGCV